VVEHTLSNFRGLFDARNRSAFAKTSLTSET
jgi:hypothetical protein